MFSPLIWKQKLYFNIFTRKHPDNCGIKIPGFTRGERDPKHCLDTRSHLMHILFFFIWYFPKDFPCQIQLQWTFWEETVGIPLPSSKLHGYVRGRWVTSDGREQSTVFRSVSSQKPNVSFTTIEGWNNGTLNCFLQKNCINPRVPLRVSFACSLQTFPSSLLWHFHFGMINFVWIIRGSLRNLQVLEFSSDLTELIPESFLLTFQVQVLIFQRRNSVQGVWRGSWILQIALRPTSGVWSLGETQFDWECFFKRRNQWYTNRIFLPKLIRNRDAPVFISYTLFFPWYFQQIVQTEMK